MSKKQSTPYFDGDSRPTVATHDEYDIEVRPARISKNEERPSEWSWAAIMSKYVKLRKMQGYSDADELYLSECETRNAFERLKNAGEPAVEFDPIAKIDKKVQIKAGSPTELCVKCWVYLPGIGTFSSIGKIKHHFHGGSPRAQSLEFRKIYEKARKRAESQVKSKVATKIAALLFLEHRKDMRAFGSVGSGWIGVAGIAVIAVVAGLDHGIIVHQLLAQIHH